MDLKHWKYEFVDVIKNGPKVRQSHEGGKILEFNKNGKFRNIEFPIYIEFYKHGQIKTMIYFIENINTLDFYDEKYQSYKNGIPFYEIVAKKI